MNDNRGKPMFQQPCPSCKKPFTLKSDISYGSSPKPNLAIGSSSRDGQKLWREPHLLHCGHPICSLCIRNKDKGESQSILCDVCKHENKLNYGLQKFPPFTYYIGLLYENRLPKRGSDLLNQKFIPLNCDTNNSSVEDSSICSKCENSPVVCKCKACKIETCDSCFNDIHSQFADTSRHQRILIPNTSEYKIDSCECHKRQMDFYCDDCETLSCPHCFHIHHKDHKQSSVLIKNKNLKEEMESSIHDLQNVEQYLRRSIKDLRISNPQRSCSSLINAIREFFNELYGHLQIREMGLIRKAEQLAEKVSGNPSELKEEAEEYLNYVVRLIADFKTSERLPNDAEFDYSEMLKQINIALKLPCVLQRDENCEPTVVDKSRFKIDCDAVMKFLGELGEVITNDVTSPIRLVSTDECDADVVVDNNDDVCSIASTSITTSTSTRESLERTCESFSAESRVQTSCVIHPGLFFVHLEPSISQLNTMEPKLNQFGDSKSAEPFTVPPKKNDLCLARFSADQKWYRGRIVSPKSQFGRLASPPEDASEDNVLVYYIDYGNCNYVALSNIRVLPVHFKETGPLATKCSLEGIVPASSDGWDPNATITFNSILTTSEYLHLRTYRIESDMHYVDIICGEDCSQSSVREMLILLRLAFLATNFSLKEDLLAKHFSYDNYFAPDVPNLGITMNVVVSHMEDPSCFYVQMYGEHINCLNEMQAALQEVYGEVEDPEMENMPDRMAVYTPVIGLDCVAKFVDGLWYRCRILSRIDDAKNIRVFYVDYGNKAKVKWRDLRRVKKEFFKYSCFALRCSLADVVPARRERVWSKAAISSFREKVDVKVPLQMTVIENKTKGDSSIALVKLAEGKECINSTLVDRKVAASTGLNSTPDAMNVCDKLWSKLSSSKGSVTEKQQSILQRYDEMNASSPQNVLMAALSRPHSNLNLENGVVEEENEDAEVQEISNQKISSEDIEFQEAEGKVSLAESPSRIYFQPFKSRQNDLNRLMLELTRAYKSSSPDGTLQWKENDYCVAYGAERKDWFRALISELSEEEERATVFCIDYGYTLNCHLNNLRVLMNKFMAERPYAILCHLSNIKAAGDKNEWTNLACETMMELIAESEKTVVTILGSSQNGSYPVDLICSSCVVEGAIEPAKVIEINLGTHLLDNGMALPVKMPVKLETVDQVGNSDSDEDKKTLLDSSKTAITVDESENGLDESLVCSSCEEVEIALPVGQCLTIEEVGSSDSSVEANVVTSDSEMVGNCQELQDQTSTSRRRWKKPKPLKKREFFCRVTYVHPDGTIYLQNLECADDLKFIQSGLKTKYCTTQPSNEDSYWIEGDICVAQIDKNWYRATIVEVIMETNKYVVQLLDFGRYATLTYANLRKKVILMKEAQLCYKCVMADIRSSSEDGNWSEPILKFLNSMLLEREDFKWKAALREWPVKITRDSLVKIDLICGDKNLAKMLLDCELAEIDSVTSTSRSRFSRLDRSLGYQSELMEEENDDDDDDSFDGISACSVPGIDERISVVLTNVSVDLTFNVQRKASDSPESALDQVVYEQSKRLREINVFLTKKFEDLEPLENPKVKDIVCCCYPTDNGWYRGYIESRASSDEFVVLFVDYGNKETVSKQDLRKLPEEFIDLPMQSILCRLHQIKIPKNENCKIAEKRLRETVYQCMGKSNVYIEIKDLTEPIKVDLLLYENENFVLPYQQLIDDGVVQLVREKTEEEQL